MTADCSTVTIGLDQSPNQTRSATCDGQQIGPEVCE